MNGFTSGFTVFDCPFKNELFQACGKERNFIRWTIFQREWNSSTWARKKIVLHVFVLPLRHWAAATIQKRNAPINCTFPRGIRESRQRADSSTSKIKRDRSEVRASYTTPPQRLGQFSLARFLFFFNSLLVISDFASRIFVELFGVLALISLI